MTSERIIANAIRCFDKLVQTPDETESFMISTYVVSHNFYQGAHVPNSIAMETLQSSLVLEYFKQKHKALRFKIKELTISENPVDELYLSGLYDEYEHVTAIIHAYL